MRNIFVFILSATLIISCSSKKTQLGLRLEKDKVYRQLMVSTANIDQDVNGQKLNMLMTVKASMSYLVKNTTDKGYELEVKYDSLSMGMKADAMEMQFSSERVGPNDYFSMILAQMRNKAFTIIMNRNGRIEEVKNIDALFADALKVPGLAPEQLIQAMEQIKKAYGAESMKSNIEMVTAIFPENEVMEGDSWTVKTRLESGMSIDVNSTYKLLASEGDHYLINGNSSMLAAKKDEYVETNGMQIKYDLNGTMLSDIKVDAKSGWIMEAKIRQDIAGNAKVKENAQLPQGLTIPMSMKSDVLVSDK